MTNMGNRTSQIEHLRELAPDPFVPNAPVSPGLDRLQLIRLSTWMGEYIRNNSPLKITLVVVGGAVNVISFQSRQLTHDVDWFKPSLSSAESEILYKAYCHAIKQAKSHDIVLPSHWFNNQAMLFVEADTRQALYYDAMRQNYTVFQAGALKLIAAPWVYGFVSKLDRIIAGTWKDYDPEDAAIYLHQHLATKKAKKIDVQAIESLIHMYRSRRPIDLTSLHIVNENYRRIYGADAIEFWQHT